MALLPPQALEKPAHSLLLPNAEALAA